MTYGPEKIPAPKVVDSIVEVIKHELMRQDCFSNTSLAYYGVELDFTIKLALHARKESHVEIAKEAQLMGRITDPEPEEVKVKGKRVAGRKLHVEPGEHTRKREGTAV